MSTQPNDRDSTQQEPTTKAVPKRPSRWPGIVALGLFLLVGGCLFLAREGAKLRHEETEMAVTLSKMGGNQFCNLAYMTADASLLDGRTPSMYAPKRVLIGPPAVFECSMLREGGVEAEPITVIKRCDDLRAACVEVR